MSSSTELSNSLRERGNRFYKSASSTTCIWLTTEMKKTRLENARWHYKDALECSTSPKEKSAANKNIAMASWKLASLGQHRGELSSVIQYRYTDALTSFQQALKCGNDAGNGDHWSSHLVNKMHECLHDSFNFMKDVPILSEERETFMCMTCKLAPTIVMKAEMTCLYSKYLFQKAVTLFQQELYKVCKEILYNCYKPLEDAKRYGKDDDYIITEITNLEEDVTFHIAVVEARQALRNADDLKQTILMTEEELNIDMVWEVLDLYKKAILLTRGKDVELEAIAMSRIGVIYDSVLILPAYAKIYFKGAVTMALTLHPRNVTNDEWYKISLQRLKAYQIHTVAEENTEWSKEMSEILKKLQPQVDKIQKNEQDVDLLKFIYKEHPPKKKEHKLPDDLPEQSKATTAQLKKCLRKAIMHYHTDRNSKDEFGKEWYVLCEEITKILTNRYEAIKLSDKTVDV